jgi:hypothetical protein
MLCDLGFVACSLGFGFRNAGFGIGSVQLGIGDSALQVGDRSLWIEVWCTRFLVFGFQSFGSRLAVLGNNGFMVWNLYLVFAV